MAIKSNIIVPNEPINRFSYFTPIESSVAVETFPANLTLMMTPKKTEGLTPEEDLKIMEDLKKKKEAEKKEQDMKFYKAIGIWGAIVFVFILFSIIYFKYDYKRVMGGFVDSDELMENSIYVQ